LKTQKQRGELRPAAYFFSRVMILILLVVPAAFSQQQKNNTVLTPKSEEVIQTNDRLAELAAATNVKPTDYVIGSGDLLDVEVFDVPELSREVRVNETGYISLPLVPTQVRASGLTTNQLQDKIAELLQSNGLVSTPRVNVTVKEEQSQPITLIGSVKNPMVIQATRHTTLIQALSQAGGISDDAGNTVIVTRPPRVSMDPGSPDGKITSTDAQTFTIRLSDLLETGDSRFNIPVIGGDVISVPRAGIIYVVGAVNHPGGFVMQNDRDRMTTLKMLSLAGGTTSTAKVKNAVILRKDPNTGKRDEVPVNLNNIMHLRSEDVTLQASDILYVPDSAAKRALHRAGDVALSLTTGVALITAGKF